jgi:DNA-binding FrmR family transcriptional regulator
MAVKAGCITRRRKESIISRLNRIKGQITGMQRMVEEGRYCLDILQQLSSTHEALRGVSKILMRNYLEICATRALQSRKKDKQDKIYSELMDIIYKFAR